MHGHTKTMLQGNDMYVMTQAPEKGKETCLSHGLWMVNTYHEMTTGSKHVGYSGQNPDSCADYYQQGHQDCLGGSCK